MKRRFRHILIWLGLIACVVMGGKRWYTSFEQDRLTNSDSLAVSSRARSVFLLDDENWITFRIPSTARRVKVLSRANLLGSAETLDGQEFDYRMNYRLESLGGRSLAEGSFDLVTKISPSVDADGKPASSVFYANNALVPSSAKASTLQLPGDQITLLHLQHDNLGHPVKDVSVRLFLRQGIPERKLAYRWERLSDSSRRRLASARLHQLIDLTPSEKRSILVNRWSPIGAQGVAGQDYRERTLYLRDDVFPAKPLLIEPLGLGEIRGGPTRRIVLGIPPSGAGLRLVCRALGTLPDDCEIVVRYYGEGLHDRDSAVWKLTGSPSEFLKDYRGGMVEVDSPVEIAVKPFLTIAGEEEALFERDTTLTRAWHGNAETPLEFALGGDRDEGGIIRINVRPLNLEPLTVTTVYLDTNGEAIETLQRSLTEIVQSHYDVLVTDGGELPIQDPVEIVARLPPGVRTVRLLGENPFLANAYTRPDKLLHRTRVPADYTRALPDPEKQPIWFGLRPVGADQRIRGHLSELIYFQTRPPEDDVDILAGRYQWEDYQPETRALGQYLLNDRDPSAPSRTEALPSLYMPIPVGSEVPLALAQVPGLELPSRRLAFVRDNSRPARLRVSVDRRQILDRELVSDRGELLLPPMDPRSQHVEVTCDAKGFACYLNYVDPTKATKIKRFAQHAQSGDELQFLVSKTTPDEELLTGMLFVPHGETRPTEITLSIEPTDANHSRQQSEGYTPRDRLYLIDPKGAGFTPVLGGEIAEVDEGQRFFIPLGADLPAGDYKVTLRVTRGAKGFLTLSKVTSGNYADARFFREEGR